MFDGAMALECKASVTGLPEIFIRASGVRMKRMTMRTYNCLTYCSLGLYNVRVTAVEPIVTAALVAL